MINQLIFCQVFFFFCLLNAVVYFNLLLQEFACNGTVIEHPEYGEVLQLQGDQRENICQWLTKTGLAKPDQLKVHGF
jgi:translation initiation factor SUI1